MISATAASTLILIVTIVYVVASILWTAPSPTARGTPSDNRQLPDGYQSKITFANNATISLFEKTTRPPGMDNGEAIDQTTMFNTKYRTFKLRQLITCTPVSYKVAYNPTGINDLYNQVGVETTITQSFYDGSTVAYYGGVTKFEPDEMEEGKLPMATVTITPTNRDPSSGAEAGPVVASVTGS